MQQLLGKVIGEFVCEVIYKYTANPFICDDIKEQCTISDDDMVKQSCLTLDELYHYEKYPESYNWGLLGWHISDLVIYDKPKELDCFRKPIDCHRGKDRENCIGCWDCEIKRPPQSWCYVEEMG